MIVVITDEAALDLERLGDAIARDNPERAITFVRDLRMSCESLGEFPKAYPLVPRYEDSGVRRRVHGNYLIFYRIGIDTVDVSKLSMDALGHSYFGDNRTVVSDLLTFLKGKIAPRPGLSKVAMGSLALWQMLPTTSN